MDNKVKELEKQRRIGIIKINIKLLFIYGEFLKDIIFPIYNIADIYHDKTDSDIVSLYCYSSLFDKIPVGAGAPNYIIKIDRTYPVKVRAIRE